jgi:hypothetical protein
VAKHFALSDLPQDKCSIIYHIKFSGDEGLFYMSDPRFTAFQEDEVLVQDGLEYSIDDVKKEKDEESGRPFITVTLSYPAKLEKK